MEQSYKAPLGSANATEWQSDKCYSLTSCVKGWWQLPCYAALPCHRRSRRAAATVCCVSSLYLSIYLSDWLLCGVCHYSEKCLSQFNSHSLSPLPPPLGRPTSAFIKGHCGLAPQYSRQKIKTYSNTYVGWYTVTLENAMLTYVVLHTQA